MIKDYRLIFARIEDGSGLSLLQITLENSDGSSKFHSQGIVSGDEDIFALIQDVYIQLFEFLSPTKLRFTTEDMKEAYDNGVHAERHKDEYQRNGTPYPLSPPL